MSNNIIKGGGTGRLIGIPNVSKILSKLINSLIADKTASNTTLKLFSTEQPNGICCQGDSSTDPINPVYIRNTNCWAKDIDTSPISIWNNGGGYSAPEHAGGSGGTGLLITKRHLIFAQHFHVKIGKKFIFVDMNNNTYVRTLTNLKNIYFKEPNTTTPYPEYPGYEIDILIGVLDSDLPDSITPMKILDPNKAIELIEILKTTKIPVFLMDVARKAYVGELKVFSNFYTTPYGETIWPYEFAISDNPTNPSKIREFYPYHPDTFGYGMSSGDSGNTCSFVYKNKLVHIFHIMEPQGGRQYMICAFKYVNEINEAINDLGNPNGYQVQLENLS
jgi:hypothetical protein